MNNMKFANMVFEWHSVWRDIKRNIWCVLLVVLIGYMGNYTLMHSAYSPNYTSTATLVVNTKIGSNTSYSNLTVSSEMANIFSEVFTQNTIKSRAAENAGYGSFKGTITSNVLTNTNIIQLGVTTDDPQRSYNQLNSVLEVYPEITDEIFDNAVIGVLKSPSLPTRPSNSMEQRNGLIIALTAGFVALCIIIFLSVIRDTVKDEASFVKNIDAKLIGSVVHQPKKRVGLKKDKRALLVHGSASIGLKFVENYYKISGRIEYLKRKTGDKVFAVTSVAENEGKSTAASNIAISLAVKGNKVLLIDLDEKKPALYKIFEFDYDYNSELDNLFSGKIKPEDYKFRRYKKTSLFLSFNTKPHKDYKRWVENGSIKAVIDALRDKVDYIIVDTAPMAVDSTVTNVVQLVDKTILVVRTDVVHITGINDAVLTISEVGGDLFGCILNDVYPEFSFLGQIGIDEGGYYSSKRYGRYSYGKNGRYGTYGKYGSYGNYGRYGNYNSYGTYGKYGDYDENAKDYTGEDVLEDSEYDGDLL